MAEVAPAERRKGVLAISVVTLIWGLNFVAAKPVARALDPFLVTFLRSAVAGLLFGLRLCLGGRSRELGPVNLRAALPLAAACILGNHVLFLYATRYTTPAHVALDIATIPVFVAVIARVFRGERLAPLRVIGIAVAFVGVALLALSGERGPAGRLGPMGGDALALAAACAFAAYTVANKSLVERVGPFTATTLLFVCGSVLLIPFAVPGLILGLEPGALTPRVMASGLYLLLASTLVAYPLFSYALARLASARVAVFTFLQPVIAGLVSYAIGLERFPHGTLGAALLVVLGVALAQKRVAPAAPAVERAP